MESPVKQPLFAAQEEKENIYSDEVAVPVKGIPMFDDELEAEELKEASVAPTLHKDEAIEPILQENPNRFVLFPIKYHEVSGFR